MGDLPIGIGSVPTVCTKENLKAILKSLPNNKSPGRSRLPYEAYKYAGDSFHDYIYEFFVLIIKTGLIPSQWSINSIIPIHKRNDTALFKNYRPLGLSEALRKIFEAFINLAMDDLFKTEDYHYGYKKNFSTSDAAYDLNKKMEELRDQGILEDYVLFKLDIQSAFDRIDHGSLKEFLQTFIDDPFFRHIMLSLLMVQRVRLCLGAMTTFYKRLRRGIIQGSKLSPKVFLALLNWCLEAGSVAIPGYKYIYADDFLVLCKKEEAGLIKDLIVEKLDLIGLTLSSEKGKCADIEEDDKWLGFYISKAGLTTDGQINRNLLKASKQAAMLRSGGIFKNRIHTHIILRVWASRVLPVLEYGLNWHKPDKKSCTKVDLFIRREIRSLTGSPRYLPNEDLRIAFQSSSFYQRWEDLYARFINHRSFKDNKPSMAIILSKVPWAFKMEKNITKMVAEEPIMKKILLRTFIDPLPETALCLKCGEHHQHVNQHIQCRFKDFSPFLLNKPPSTITLKLTLPKTTIQLAATQLKYAKDLSIHLYTDASYCPVTHKSNGGVCLFNSSGTTKYYGFNNTHLQIRSSTRGEIATIVEAINRTALPKRVKVYTDSQNAIEAFEKYLDGTICYSKIDSIDLWLQLKKNVELIEIMKVDGHKDNKLNNFVDEVAHLGFDYSNSKLKKKGRIITLPRLENDKSHFKIFSLTQAIREKTLKRKDYLLECVDLGRWFALATAMAGG